MKKVTCIVGSARSNGSCAYLIDTFIEGMKEKNVSVSKYCISEANIHYCCGCKQCYEDGNCVFEDDV